MYNNYTVTKHDCREWKCCTPATSSFQVTQLVPRLEFDGSVHIQAIQTHFLEVQNVKQHIKNSFTCTECKTAYNELPNLHSRQMNPASDAHISQLVTEIFFSTLKQTHYFCHYVYNITPLRHYPVPNNPSQQPETIFPEDTS
jgi:hypothetical protein